MVHQALLVADPAAKKVRIKERQNPRKEIFVPRLTLNEFNIPDVAVTPNVTRTTVSSARNRRPSAVVTLGMVGRGTSRTETAYHESPVILHRPGGCMGRKRTGVRRLHKGITDALVGAERAVWCSACEV